MFEIFSRLMRIFPKYSSSYSFLNLTLLAKNRKFNCLRPYCVLAANSGSMLVINQMSSLWALAEFEKLEHTMTITATTLEKDGFESENPLFTCLVAELSDGYIIGYALYYTSYSTWLGRSIFLEDLYVQPAYRKNGIGTQLFLAVAKIAHETPSKRMDFHVLSWNPAGDFYKRLGAVDMTIHEKWHHFRMDKTCLNRLFSTSTPTTQSQAQSRS